MTTTEDHPFWNASDGEWQRAEDLAAGEAVLTADDEQVAVGGIDWATRTRGMAYNLTVAALHTYFVAVGNDEVLVHNTCRKAPDLDNLDDKIKRDMVDRGWTEQDILEAYANQMTTHNVWDRTTKQPATAYARSDNEYVIVNDVTGNVVHVSDKNKPDWKPEWESEQYQE